MVADTKNCYPQIWQCVAAIPPGRVAAYGQVAKLAGLPRGARVVGSALRAAPENLQLPWHRVVSADGRIALRAGSSGRDLQIQRLLTEGVRVTGGRIDMKKFEWQPDLDEMIWGPLGDSVQ